MRTAAIATDADNLDLEQQPPAGSRATTATATCASRSTTKPVFVGIAGTKNASAYLRGTAHATVTDFRSDPFRAVYRTEPGAARPAPAAPASKPIWAASAHGGALRASSGTSSTATGRSWS